jgi:hypothetical protein
MLQRLSPLNQHIVKGDDSESLLRSALTPKKKLLVHAGGAFGLFLTTGSVGEIRSPLLRLITLDVSLYVSLGHRVKK